MGPLPVFADDAAGKRQRKVPTPPAPPPPAAGRARRSSGGAARLSRIRSFRRSIVLHTRSWGLLLLILLRHLAAAPILRLLFVKNSSKLSKSCCYSAVLHRQYIVVTTIRASYRRILQVYCCAFLHHHARVAVREVEPRDKGELIVAHPPSMGVRRALLIVQQRPQQWLDSRLLRSWEPVPWRVAVRRRRRQHDAVECSGDAPGAAHGAAHARLDRNARALRVLRSDPAQVGRPLARNSAWPGGPFPGRLLVFRRL